MSERLPRRCRFFLSTLAVAGNAPSVLPIPTPPWIGHAVSSDFHNACCWCRWPSPYSASPYSSRSLPEIAPLPRNGQWASCIDSGSWRGRRDELGRAMRTGRNLIELPSESRNIADVVCGRSGERIRQGDYQRREADEHDQKLPQHVATLVPCQIAPLQKSAWEMDVYVFGRSRIRRSRISVGVTRTSGHHDSSASSPAASEASIPSAIPLRTSVNRTISGANPPSGPAL